MYRIRRTSIRNPLTRKFNCIMADIVIRIKIALTLRYCEQKRGKQKFKDIQLNEIYSTVVRDVRCI